MDKGQFTPRMINTKITITITILVSTHHRLKGLHQCTILYLSTHCRYVVCCFKWWSSL